MFKPVAQQLMHVKHGYEIGGFASATLSIDSIPICGTIKTLMNDGTDAAEMTLTLTTMKTPSKAIRSIAQAWDVSSILRTVGHRFGSHERRKRRRWPRRRQRPYIDGDGVPNLIDGQGHSAEMLSQEQTHWRTSPSCGRCQ